MLFAATISMLCIKKPYTIQRNKPAPMIRNIKKDMSLVSFILQDFISWGTRDVVVSMAATNPISVIPQYRIYKKAA